MQVDENFVMISLWVSSTVGIVVGVVLGLRSAIKKAERDIRKRNGRIG